MKEFFQALQDAFPALRNHPVLVARLLLLFLILGLLYAAKERRKTICARWFTKLYGTKSRWLFVDRNHQEVYDWKYYTSETSGKGKAGDDIVWTLVKWPGLKAQDSFRVPGAVGMLTSLHDSQVKLRARWEILHDPNVCIVGSLPPSGLLGKLRRAAANLILAVGSI